MKLLILLTLSLSLLANVNISNDKMSYKALQNLAIVDLCEVKVKQATLIDTPAAHLFLIRAPKREAFKVEFFIDGDLASPLGMSRMQKDDHTILEFRGILLSHEGSVVDHYYDVFRMKVDKDYVPLAWSWKRVLYSASWSYEVLDEVYCRENLNK